MKYCAKYLLGLLLGATAAAGVLFYCQFTDDFPVLPAVAEARAEISDKPSPSPVALSSQPLAPALKTVVRAGKLESPFAIASLSVLPGERVPVGISAEGGAGLLAATASASSGILRETGENLWEWTAPPGPAVATLSLQPAGASPVTLNLLVMTPYSELKRRALNGYAIGEYPAKALKNNPAYSRPRGFVEVTPENENLLVSPHFRLKQFLCKQESGYPKYLVLNELLILKLEHILAEVNGKGYRADSFHVMSGYRTPAYNQGLGNVKYSMHQFGYAADIFIDESPKDGNMDDLNRDGKSNELDALVLSRIIEGMDRDPEYRQFAGGLGSYEKTQAHGPFVHVDVRGWGARW
jgi:hypothetical protein